MLSTSLLKFIHNKKNIIILLLFLFPLFQIVFFKRAIFFSVYDTVYWKDRYEHSQYQLPLSKRIIGDDGLYAYTGYRVISGDDPFSINVDKPPVGKYLIGASIKLFKNPVYGSLIFGIFSLLVYFKLAYFLIKDKFWSLLATLFLFLDPMFFSQLFISGLDIYQLFFLLLSLSLVVKIYTSKKHLFWQSLFAGLALGFFIETKPPILLPIIFLLETAVFIWRSKKLYGIFLLGIIVGIFIPYFRYLELGHSLVDVLRIHKYMLSFYQESKLSVHAGAILQAFFLGKFPHITNGNLLSIAEWSIVWPILGFITVLSFFNEFKHKGRNYLSKTLLLLIFLSFLVYSLIPSYPRYLLTILPFLYVFTVKFLKERIGSIRNYILGGLILFSFINAFLFLQPSSEVLLDSYFYNFKNQYFKDVYQENIGKDSQKQISRDDFYFEAKSLFESAGIRGVNIYKKKSNIPKLFGNQGEVEVKAEYVTQDLGKFYEDKEIHLVKEMGQWKIKWDWGLLLSDFKPGYKIRKDIEIGRRGSLIGEKGTISEDTESYLISVNPAKIDRGKEEEMLRFIGYLGNQKWLYLHNAYLENVLPNTYVPLVTAFRPLDGNLKNKLLSYPGVLLIPYPGRIYYSDSDYDLGPEDIENVEFEECCTRIYSSSNYRGVDGEEKFYDKMLLGNNGGEIVLLDSEGNFIRSLIKKEAKNGRDVDIGKK